MINDPLLTKRDLAEHWKVTPQAIENWIRDGRLTPCMNVPGDVRFNPDYIAELEDVKLDKVSPLERQRMEREIEYLKLKLQKAECALARVQSTVNEFMYIGTK